MRQQRNYRLPEGLLNRLAAHTERTGLTETYVVEEALQQYLSREERDPMSYQLTPIEASEIGASDLHAEANSEFPTTSSPWDCYRLRVDGQAEIGWVIISDGRAGVALGGDARWTDAEDAEDAVERFLGIHDKQLIT